MQDKSRGGTIPAISLCSAFSFDDWLNSNARATGSQYTSVFIKVTYIAYSVYSSMAIQIWRWVPGSDWLLKQINPFHLSTAQMLPDVRFKRLRVRKFHRVTSDFSAGHPQTPNPCKNPFVCTQLSCQWHRETFVNYFESWWLSKVKSVVMSSSPCAIVLYIDTVHVLHFHELRRWLTHYCLTVI